jgi:pyruvate,orthophosphate dikinase
VAKLVYEFGRGHAAGHAGMKDLLGGKGANLAEMTNLGLPVPPGFTIATRACNLYFGAGNRMPPELRRQVERALGRLERVRGKRFGDPRDPLLVSVRSGAKFSMPGMMDTILNLGLNDRTVAGLARSSGDRRFAFDSYRRFVQMYGAVVLGVDKGTFSALLDEAKRERRVSEDTGLTAADLERLVERFQAAVTRSKRGAFPQDPEAQLWGAIAAVFRSWNTERARLYRQRYGIPDDLGTAVNVQTMVFGNLGDDCATGVAFTRNPSNGDDYLYGEYLPNAQGEDVVAGIRTPLPISNRQVADGKPQDTLENRMPQAYRDLSRIRQVLERHYRDMQDVEFTVERGQLYMLQTRTGKRTGHAALRIAFDFHRARAIDRKELVLRIEPDALVQLLAPGFDPRGMERARQEGRSLARGLPAGPGAAAGAIVFTAERARELADRGQTVILVRTETSPEDIGGMVAAAGILTTRGGMTSHAAVVARGMGKPCVVGAEALQVDEQARRLRADGRTLAEGEALSMDGTSGEVIRGALEPQPSEIVRVLVERTLTPGRSVLYPKFAQLMKWADGFRSLKVRTNADTPHDSSVARAFGAEGIGLCRTEHMFFGDDRIPAVRQLILSEDESQRRRALSRLLPMQRGDFHGIFVAMDGLPVTIRLLDPPLHEFLPQHREQFVPLAREMGTTVKALMDKAEQLHETNPMLGHRGCRLGITFPEIYEMQVRAIFEAAAACRRKGIRVRPEVMIPLVGTVEELRDLNARTRAVADAVLRQAKQKVPYQVGTMIEIPRACVVSDEIATEAQFFSFGTNDLTQMTYGYSRDDAAKFLPAYLDRRLLPADPFQTLDQQGVGQLIRESVTRGRGARADLKLGVCGEHGGDARSVEFFHRVGMDYVSCSPYRVPVARLAAAHAALRQERGEATGSV